MLFCIENSSYVKLYKWKQKLLKINIKKTFQTEQAQL